MANTIELNVEIKKEAEVLASLKKMDDAAKSLSKNNYEIRINTRAIQDAVRALTDLEQRLRTMSTTTWNINMQFRGDGGMGNNGGGGGGGNRNNNPFLQRDTRTFDQNGDMTRRVRDYSRALGETTRVIETLNQETQELEQTQTVLTTNYTQQAQAAQRAAEAQQRAARQEVTDLERQRSQVTTLQGQYANLQRQIEAASGKYASGTFDGISEAVRAARQQIDAAASSFENGTARADVMGNVVAGLAQTLRELSAAFSIARADGVKLEDVEQPIEQVSSKLINLGDVAEKVFARLETIIRGRLKKAFQEALTTMRAVDQELANIQKVTDAPDNVIRALGQSAYGTAAKYGVSVNEYLTGAAAFAKAGYENYDQLAELAIKTQLVGDVTDEVAQKFLIAANAAFKYNGDIDDLSSVLDKANVIENNFATSIEKIAAGFPIVATTASMANMSVDELMAALGTITASTQESGTKAATALRALILNILGDTKTEIEDGVTWTEEELKSLNGILWTYSRDVMEAAAATGKLVDPMEAIAGLSKAFKEGFLNEQELESLAAKLGGKLRTNQLMALIQNFDTYQKMLGMVENAAGSADREVEIMLDTWNAKTNILKNTFAAFVSNTLNSDFFKALTDMGTFLLKAADNAWVLVAAYGGLKAAMKGAALGKAAEEMAKLADHTERAAKMARAGEVLKGIGKVTTVITGTVMAVKMVSQAIQDYRQKQIEAGDAATQQAKNISELYDQYLVANQAYQDGTGTQEDLKTAVDNLNGSLGDQKIGVDELAGAYGGLTDKLKEATVAEINASVVKARNAEDAARQGVEGFFHVNPRSGPQRYGGYLSQFEELSGTTEAFGTPQYFRDITDAANAYVLTLERGSAEEKRLSGWLGKMTPIVDEYLEAAHDRAEVEALLERVINGETKATNNSTDAKTANTEATEEQNKSLVEQAQNLTNARKAVEDYKKSLEVEEKDDVFTKYAKAYKTLEEEIAAGRLNSNAFWASAEFLLGPEVLDRMGWNAEKVAEHVKGLSEMFGDAESAGTGLLSVMEQMADGVGNIEDETGRVIAHIERDANGDFLWNIYDAEALAEKIGITEESVRALSEAMGVYSEVAVADQEEVEDATEAVKGKQDELKSGLEETDGVSLDNVTGAVWGLDDALYSAAEHAAGLAGAMAGVGSGGGRFKGDMGPMGDYTGYGPTFASGTRNAPGGPALVNELGPELISDRGTAYIANGGRPAIVSLSPGAVVLDAEQTRAAVGGARNIGPIPAYDGGLIGMVSATTGYRGLNKTPGTAVSNSGGGGGGSGSGSATVDYEEKLKTLDDVLKALDARAKLADKRLQHQIEADLYGEAQKKIDEMLAELRAAGYTDDSEEIVKLETKLLEYAEDQKKALQHVWDDLEDALDKTLDNLNAQAELATNEGDIAGANALYGQAQDEIQELLDKYLEAGYAETSDEVLTLKNKIYDYADKMTDLAELAWKELKGSLDDVLSGLEKQAELATKLKDYEKANGFYARARDVVQQAIDDALKQGLAEDSKEVVDLKLQLLEYGDKIVDLTAKRFEELEKALSEAIGNIDQQITYFKNGGDKNTLLQLYGAAQDKINDLIQQYLDAGYSPTSNEVLALSNKGFQYASAQRDVADSLWKDLLDALKDLAETEDEANELAEKQLAVDEARAAYENAQKQRTVRIFNPVTGQWEWVADSKDIQNASKALETAEKNLFDTQLKQDLSAIQNGTPGDLANLTIGPALAARMGAASPEAMQSFANALQAVYGSASYFGDPSVMSAFAGKGDSHDTNYYFPGGITLTEEQARTTTLADIAASLRVLGITA